MLATFTRTRMHKCSVSPDVEVTNSFLRHLISSGRCPFIILITEFASFFLLRLKSPSLPSFPPRFKCSAVVAKLCSRLYPLARLSSPRHHLLDTYRHDDGEHREAEDDQEGVLLIRQAATSALETETEREASHSLFALHWQRCLHTRTDLSTLTDM